MIKRLFNFIFRRKHTVSNVYKPILVFRLGHLEVFHYQTEAEFLAKAEPKAIYWHKVGEYKSHGPFDTVYEAVNHYSKNLNPLMLSTNNLIPVDFKAKKRIK